VPTLPQSQSVVGLSVGLDGDVMQQISISNCPNCKKKTKIPDSREHILYGFATVRRRRSCLYCDFKVSTIEITLEMANQIFKED